MRINYNEFFDNNPDHEFFYNKPGYGPVLIDGVVNLQNAISRMKKGEYYVLVTYKDDESLPVEYSAIDLGSNDCDVRFATVNDKAYYYNISINGGIQRISNLGDGSFLLGPGPDTIDLPELVSNLHTEYMNSMENNNENQNHMRR